MSKLQHALEQLEAIVPATEEVANGKTALEIELTFYGLIKDVNELKNAVKVIRQEQYGIPVHDPKTNTHLGGIRVRKVTENVDGTLQDQYVLTTKTKQAHGINDETNLEVSADLFEQFKLLAGSGLKKDRYVFAIDGEELVWEVDMFTGPDGFYYPWCKIDLEVTEDRNDIPALPMQFTELLTSSDKSDAVQTKIRELYKQYFDTPSTQSDVVKHTAP